MIDEAAVLRAVPRGSAQVLVFFNATTRGNDDVVHLRAVERVTGNTAPQVSDQERVFPLDTRQDDNAQRDVLRHGLRRVLLPFVDRHLPGAARVELDAPAQAKADPKLTTPWDFGIWTGGFWNWSEDFQSGNAWVGLSIAYMVRSFRFQLTTSADYRFDDRPDLIVDGRAIDVSTDSHALQGRFVLERNLDANFSLGWLVRIGGQDTDRLYRATARTHLGLAYDVFAPDAPRGNRFSVAYLAGYQGDAYHQRNVLGEDHAGFLTHGLVAGGAVRLDTLTFNLRGRLVARAFDPAQRFVAEIVPELTLQAGAHVDISVSLAVTKQAIPPPAEVDASRLDTSNLNYAQPLRVNSSLSILLHWDRDNSVRNDRWVVSDQLADLDTL